MLNLSDNAQTNAVADVHLTHVGTSATKENELSYLMPHYVQYESRTVQDDYLNSYGLPSSTDFTTLQNVCNNMALGEIEDGNDSCPSPSSRSDPYETDSDSDYVPENFPIEQAAEENSETEKLDNE